MATGTSSRLLHRKENSPRKHRRNKSLRFESLQSRAMMAADLLQLDQSQYAADHFLVQFRDGISQSAALSTSVTGAKITKQVSTDGWYQATLTTGGNLLGSLSAFQNLMTVATATPDFRVSLTAVPNDTNYANQWALENRSDADIDASQAWDYGTSSSVVVAVIDTGVDYTHVDLAANIWTNTREIAGNGVDDDRNGYTDDIRGWNFVNDNNNPADDNGHGTHVAGTIGAVGNNGISGVAWSVKVMALKFLDSTGSGNLSDAVGAIDYARLNGAKVINASWGGGGFSSALQSAITRFQNAGGIFVAAAGNEGANNATTPSYPANYTNVISVAASTSTGALASFSNYGTNVDIVAPGQSILSTIPGNRYASYSGTSMAAPHVAGALALLWGQSLPLSPALSATQLISLVMSNTDAVLTNRTQYGHLNVGKAAAALAGSTGRDTTAPYVLNAVFNEISGGVSSIDMTFSEPVMSSTMVASAFEVTGPGGPIAIARVVLISGNVWRVSFSTQTAPGAYTIVVLPTIRDAAGNLLNQDRDTISGEQVQDRYTATFTLSSPATRNYSATGPVALPDATNTRVGTTTIAINVPDSFSISDLNVVLSVDHTYVSDLRIRLIAPDGTSVQLVNRRGGDSDNLRLTLDDEATSILASAATLSGTYRPERLLSAFDGKNAAGSWKLEIVDAARLDTGVLNSVQLQFTGTATTASTTGPGSSASQAASSVASWIEWLRSIWRV
jgi:serine protease